MWTIICGRSEVLAAGGAITRIGVKITWVLQSVAEIERVAVGIV
jgi:hypothetical protein